MNRKRTYLSRRQFLAYMGTAVGTGVLAACAPKATPAPEPTSPPPTPKPTTPPPTPTSAMVNERGLLVPSGITKGPGVKLTFWNTEGAEVKSLVEEVIRDFEALTGNTVVIEDVPFADHFAKLPAAIQAGEGPDVHHFTVHQNLLTWAAGGLFAPAPDGFITKEESDLFPEGWARGHSLDGKLYGIPYDAPHCALVYDADVVPEPPSTYEELIEIAKGLTTDSYSGFLFPSTYWMAHSLWTGFGSYGFKETATGWDPNDIGFDNAQGIEAGLFVKRLVDEGIIPTTLADLSFIVLGSRLKEKSCAMALSGDWDVGPMREAGINVGVAPIPTMPGGGIPKPYVNFNCDAVPITSKYPEEAWKLAKYFAMELPSRQGWLEQGRGQCRSDVAQLPIVQNDPVAKGFAAQKKNVVLNPAFPGGDLQFAPMQAALGLIAAGQDVETTLHEQVAAIRESLAELLG